MNCGLFDQTNEYREDLKKLLFKVIGFMANTDICGTHYY
jgi:hypothetical protein